MRFYLSETLNSNEKHTYIYSNVTHLEESSLEVRSAGAVDGKVERTVDYVAQPYV